MKGEPEKRTGIGQVEQKHVSLWITVNLIIPWSMKMFCVKTKLTRLQELFFFPFSSVLIRKGSPLKSNCEFLEANFLYQNKYLCYAWIYFQFFFLKSSCLLLCSPIKALKHSNFSGLPFALYISCFFFLQRNEEGRAEEKATKILLALRSWHANNNYCFNRKKIIMVQLEPAIK